MAASSGLSAEKGKGDSSGSSAIALGKGGKRLKKIDLALAEQQLRVLNQQESFQNFLFQTAGPLIERFGGQLTEMDEISRSSIYGEAEAAQRANLEDQRAFDETGGAATPEQRRLISEQTENALNLGRSDIRAGLTEGLGLLKRELAPGLGLRPSDSPVIDRGGLLAREALRLESNLSLGLREQQAKSELEYPLAARTVSNQNAQLQAGIKEFQASLRDSAFRNRLALTGTVANAGLGLGRPTSTDDIFRSFTYQAPKSTSEATRSVGASGGAEVKFDVGSLLGSYLGG